MSTLEMGLEEPLTHSKPPFPWLTLPPELVDRICFEVTGVPNLLSLGLTCKFLAAIIFPNHILYYKIQAPITYEYFWIYLIQNPLLCRYIRRLEIRDTKICMPPLKQDTALVASFPYQRNPMEDNFWCYELFTRAMLQMTNLRAFFWERVESPVLFTRGELWKCLVRKNKQGKLDRDYSMDKVLQKSSRPDYVPFFDTSAVIPLWSLISLTVVSRLDNWNSGESLVGLIRHCQGLEYLSLFVCDHVLVKGFVTFCRLPKLRVLSVNLYRDRSPAPSQTIIADFFEYHVSLIRVKWFVSLRPGSRLEIENFPPNSLPGLECIEADPYFTTLLLSTPCHQPRPLRKIIRFPLNTQLLADPTLGLLGIDTSCLRTVSFKRISSFADISRFASHFPNLECLDISHSDIPTGIWDTHLRGYHIPPQTLTRWLGSLSPLTKLRYLRGMQFFTELDGPEIIRIQLELVMRVFPCLEFFSDPFSAMDAIQITRNGASIDWKPTELSQWDLYFGLEGDSTI